MSCNMGNAVLITRFYFAKQECSPRRSGDPKERTAAFQRDGWSAVAGQTGQEPDGGP
jgi:hypothetical protein